MKVYFSLFLLIVTFAGCQPKNGLIESLMKDSGKFNSILENPDKFKVQIIYTQINRDSANNPSFQSHSYRLDSSEYFYPASSIKLPMAALALEKINDLGQSGFSKYADMYVDSVYMGQTEVKSDTTSATHKASIAHFIKKVFLVSDNDAFNRLYEFVGQESANNKMRAKGYSDVRITHRLSILLPLEANRCTNPMQFYQGESLVYSQDSTCIHEVIKSDEPIYVGSKYIQGDSLIDKPMEFTFKNAIGLQSLHDVLLSLIFPEDVPVEKRFNLKDKDYQFLHEYMSKYPGESTFPKYGGQYSDDYCKFLMFGGTNQAIDPNIRVFNKIGQAYGFLIDMAYIVDFKNNIEFLLGAVIYVNENETLNDGVYEYESIGFPFMRDLGQLFYEYELKRSRPFQPDLNKYNWKLWQN